MRLAWLVTVFALAGCGGGSSSSTHPDLRAASDFSTVADLGTDDATIADLSLDDGDVDGAVDLATPPDLARLPDLVRLPDLRPGADAGLCDNVVCGAMQKCCPCTGMCYAQACLACCMFCP
jgi:hypothetical protein